MARPPMDFARSARWLASGAAGLAAAVAATVLTGWATGIDALTSPVEGVVAMHPVTAVGVLVGAAGVGLHIARPGRAGRAASLAAGTALAFLGALRLLAPALGIQQAMDACLVPAGAPEAAIAASTAACFLLLGLALAMLGRRPRLLSGLLACASQVLALLTLVLYTYGLRDFGGLLASFQMAFLSALAFLLLGLAVLEADALGGPFRVAHRPDEGGLLARRLLPVAVGVPIVLGYLRLAGELQGLYPSTFGVALFGVSTTVVLVAIILIEARSLSLADARRKAIEARLAADLLQTDEAERVTGRGSWAWDLDSDRATWSAGMYRLLGVDQSSFQNSNENFLALVHPDDRQRMGSAMAVALERGGTFLQDYRILRPDGQARHLRGEGKVVLGPSDRPRQMYGFVQDVTELRALEQQAAAAQAAIRASEARFRALFADNPVAMGIARADGGGFIDVNAAYADLLGYPRTQLLAPGFDLASIYAEPSERAALLAQVQGHGVGTMEVRLRRRDGATRTCVATLRPIDVGAAPGAPTILSAIVDVTQLRVAEAEARQERAARAANAAEVERLRRNEEFLAGFVNSTAHELATPMTPIVLQLHAIQRAGGKVSPAGVDLLARNMERMRKVVEGIVAAARVQGGQAIVRPTALDVGAIARAAVQGMAPRARPGLVVAADGPPLTAWGDAGLVRNALDNLLDNAVRLTPAPGRIDVAWAEAGERVRIEVRDTGPGIEPTERARLFRPYGQVGSEVRTDSGIGLGLYVVGRLARLQGGEAGVESAGLGKGATFWFTLPKQPMAQGLA